MRACKGRRRTGHKVAADMCSSSGKSSRGTRSDAIRAFNRIDAASGVDFQNAFAEIAGSPYRPNGHGENQRTMLPSGPWCNR